MKLISMTDFVLQQNYITTLDISQIDFYDKELSVLSNIRNYANFLKQPLKLEMFVPCDEDGNVIELHNACICTDLCYLCKKYKKAKERVLFRGIDLDTAKFHCNRNDRTIEYFTSFNVELTPNAIKRVFG